MSPQQNQKQKAKKRGDIYYAKRKLICTYCAKQNPIIYYAKQEQKKQNKNKKKGGGDIYYAKQKLLCIDHTSFCLA